MVILAIAVERRNRFQALAIQVPDARTVDLVDFTCAAGNQLCGFKQRVIGAVALPGQAQDQILLRTHPVQVLQLHSLGLLVQLKSNMQRAVLIYLGFTYRCFVFCFDYQQIAA
ncbi:hypothetical protein D9M73_174740 [compost metagenome]